MPHKVESELELAINKIKCTWDKPSARLATLENLSSVSASIASVCNVSNQPSDLYDELTIRQTRLVGQKEIP